MVRPRPTPRRRSTVSQRQGCGAYLERKLLGRRQRQRVGLADRPLDGGASERELVVRVDGVSVSEEEGNFIDLAILQVEVGETPATNAASRPSVTAGDVCPGLGGLLSFYCRAVHRHGRIE